MSSEDYIARVHAAKKLLVAGELTQESYSLAKLHFKETYEGAASTPEIKLLLEKEDKRKLMEEAISKIEKVVEEMAPVPEEEVPEVDEG